MRQPGNHQASPMAGTGGVWLHSMTVLLTFHTCPYHGRPCSEGPHLCGGLSCPHLDAHPRGAAPADHAASSSHPGPHQPPVM